MDKLIKRFDARQDTDLMITQRGVAYQGNMRFNRVAYDENYLAKIDAYENTPIANRVNAGRLDLIERYVPKNSTVLDIGAGSGAMVRLMKKAGFQAAGYDVCEEARHRLLAEHCFQDDPHLFDAITMWDAIEHMDTPETRIGPIRKDCYLFISLPIFEDLARIRESKHYRPGEHLYYFTQQGFIDWMRLYGFRCLEESSHETDAGREQIGAFAFRRDLPDYHDFIALYRQMHDSRYYGSSAVELHLNSVAAAVAKHRPNSILDFGAGRSDLAAHFWLDGARRIAKYDPAINTTKRMPEGEFDMVFCCDVMEHIPMSSVDQILTEIKQKSKTVVFTISTKLARAKLPDGSNAHCTLLTGAEWRRWIGDYFGNIDEMPSRWEHELILVAGGK